MASNFGFLKKSGQYESFADACLEAEKSIAVSPATCAVLSRRALELAVKWVYSSDAYLQVPYQDNLSSLIHDRTFRDVLEPDLFPLIKYVVKLGNVAAHTAGRISREEAALALRNLHQFVSWIEYCYSPGCFAGEFREDILPTGDEQKVTRAELERLYAQLGTKDRKLKDVVTENEQLRAELKKAREQNEKTRRFTVETASEFQTRKHYIDLDLKDGGWIFGDDCIEEYEVEGMPFGSGKGYVDYVLFGDNGRPLAVVEAKKASKNPNEGKQQAVLYAGCLEKKFGRRPVIFYTNGFEHYLWDDACYPPRRVSGFYSKEELQLLVDRRTDRTPLNHLRIKDEITNRYYQKEAVKAVCDSFANKERKALLVMATGSGKTRTVISLVDILARHNWVKNTLFLADRTALVRQAKNSFNNLLLNMSLCNLLDSKDSPDSRIVFSTYPTMMNAIDETKSPDGKKLFTTGHFELVIIDESHRSIYRKYQAIFDYFDALLVGLTATPKNDIDKNTYHIFDLENNVPTYAYELDEAVRDGYLVPYNTVETGLKFLEQGISYDELSDEEKEQYEETFDDEGEMPDRISGEALNRWLFNDDTIDKVLAILMERGLKVEGGDRLGKTIIFAKNHRHAEHIAERFDMLYPHYRGGFARVIDNQVNYAQDLIDKFSDKNKIPQIAVSVDMLDTGIDIPEVLNLVFFKKVRSKAKFWQMIGRGTRLCKDLFGPGQDKERFLIFDFCGNFEFFRVNQRSTEAKNLPSLTEKIFNTRVDLVKGLQHLDYLEEKYVRYRAQLIQGLIKEIKRLDRHSFVVKQHLRYVDKYSEPAAWEVIGVLEMAELKEHVAPLIVPAEEDELAKRFDYLMFTIETALVLGRNYAAGREKVIRTADALAQIGTIPQVLAQKVVIDRVRTQEFWAVAGLQEFEAVREALRDLVKFIERETQPIYYTNFTDEILTIEERPGEYVFNDLRDYRKKVNTYIRENENHITIHKLKTNKPLTKQDVLALEQILWKDVGTKDDYEREFGDTPVSLLVRQIVGLDQQAANGAFSEFLNDQNLDARQSRFVKTIVDYVVKNGVMTDKRVLQEDPFQGIGSIADIFTTEKAMKIVSIIDWINKNATDVIGA